jgi:hypothetical protein
MRVAKKAAAIEKNPVGAPGYTAAEIAKFKATMLEWLPQGRTTQQVFVLLHEGTS